MSWFSRIWGSIGGKQEPEPATGQPESLKAERESLKAERESPKAEPESPKERSHDEEKMIDKLYIHMKVKIGFIERLRAEGIECEPTVNNDPRGDVFIIKAKDAPRVREIIRNLESFPKPPQRRKARGKPKGRRAK
jgi:hypothetical protein